MSVDYLSVERIAVPTVPVWRLNVDQYHRMIRSGILTEDDPVELLEGILVPKMTKSPRRRACTRRVRIALEARVPAGWYVDAQEPITLADSEPEPDISVTRLNTSDTVARHPAATEVGLVVEVADTTLTGDRTNKKRVYARGGIPSMWIVNLADEQVEAYSQPTGPEDAPDYGVREVFDAGESVPLILDGRDVTRIAVHELIPPRDDAHDA